MAGGIFIPIYDTTISGITYIHPINHSASMIEESTDRLFMSEEERLKLLLIEEEANKYAHPENHPASILLQDSNNRLVSDTQINGWALKTHKHTTDNEKISHKDILDNDYDVHPQYLNHSLVQDPYDFLIATSSGVVGKKNLIETKALLGITTISGALPLFYSFSNSESLSYTNSSTPIVKVNMSLVNLPAGTYRIGWYYEWSRDNASNRFLSDVIIDNDTYIMESSVEIKDTKNYVPASGFWTGDITTGNHAILLRYYGSTSNNTSYIRKARLEMWRIV